MKALLFLRSCVTHGDLCEPARLTRIGDPSRLGAIGLSQ